MQSETTHQEVELTFGERLLVMQILASIKYNEMAKAISTYKYITELAPKESEVISHKVSYKEKGIIEYNVPEELKDVEYKYMLPCEVISDFDSAIKNIVKTRGIIASDAVKINDILERLGLSLIEDSKEEIKS
jgi:hypothetical protein